MTHPGTFRLLRLRLVPLLAVLAVVLPLRALAQRGELAAMHGTVSDSYDFWHYAPPEFLTLHQRVPVIMFLHGASLCGRDLNYVMKYGLIDAIKRGRYCPCMVIAPQNPGGVWNPHKLIKILDWLEAHYDVDTTRVYVMGMSLGGYGTLDLAGTYPQRIAAAMAMCGGSTLKDFTGLGQVPLWILHGTADRAVSIKESKKVVRAIQASGHDHMLRYDWLPGASHGDLARLLYLKETFDWLFAHSLADNPREVERMITISVADMRAAYQWLDPEATRYDVVPRISGGHW